MLTEQQITQFHTFGFLVLRNIITEDEHKIVSEEVEKGYANKDKSEFIGGCDIVKEMYEKKELQAKLAEKKISYKN